jgi:hypothetical protein
LVQDEVSINGNGCDRPVQFSHVSDNDVTLEKSYDENGNDVSPEQPLHASRRPTVTDAIESTGNEVRE